ncbi:substrate-binding and VWA domain-containing protein [Phytoactinopolyspora halophila]|uniref:substrate-binding and VWA domain-containing protein n=1 Tax=Phytoactinopolyspora halophila TaxID=1981511 RepID=UPI0013DDF9A1|nr:substrate-binding and VWA domain-containing protein [Phytoactinopolyspora halophila]
MLGLLAGAGYLVRDFVSGDEQRPGGPGGEAQASCDDTLALAVAAAPDIFPAISEIVRAYEAEDGPSVDGRCVSVDVTPVPSAEAVESLDGDDAPDLWLPESSIWLQRASETGAQLGESRSIATSPLVMVAPQGVAEEQLGWPDAEVAWSNALSDDVAMTITDPMSTSEGLATLLAVQAATGESGESQTQLVEAMTTVSDNTVADVDEAYGQVVDDPAAAPLFTATEQSVVAHNVEHPDSPVVALYPEDGTAVFDYPAALVGADDADAATAEAVDGVVDALRDDAAAAALDDAGFRAPDGTAGEVVGAVEGVQPRMPDVMASPEPETVTAALRQWAALSLEMRMLAVIDVSGSMWETDGGEQTRIELVRDANLAALDLIPPTSDLGLWAFSTEEDPPNHWRELVGIGPLDEELGEGTRLDALTEEVTALPDSEVRGWTALYETAWAAYQEVKENYDPNKVNSVVLLTDGEDEWGPDLSPEMDLDTLLTQLRAQHDPARPVLLITIGIGPDADMDALRQISEATGASAYQAEDPEDIQDIFFRAMLERQCRPNC